MPIGWFIFNLLLGISGVIWSDGIFVRDCWEQKAARLQELYIEGMDPTMSSQNHKTIKEVLFTYENMICSKR